MDEKQWSPKRAFDLRLDRAAREASEAIRLCGPHTDAAERFLRRLISYIDDGDRITPGSSGPRAA